MKSAKILICEDEAVVAADLDRSIQRLGHQVCGIASGGKEVVELARQHRPDLVLMDIALKDGSRGTDVAKLLMNQFDIPCIYLTGSSDEQTMAEADESDPLGYLVKPVDDQELGLTIRYGLAQHLARKTLKEELSTSQATAERATRVLNDIKATVVSEARMEGLQEIIGGIAHHYNNSLLALGLPLEILITGGTLRSFERRLVNRMLARFGEEKEFVRGLIWASGTGGLTRSVQSVVELTQKATEASNLKLPSSMPIKTSFPRDPLEAFVDPEALCAAIGNLLANAREAVGVRGKITVAIEVLDSATDKVFHASRPSGEFIRITVADSGPGISSDDLPHVSEPFFTTHAERVATGLGLTETYGIVKSHGGWLEIDSLPEQGTQARIYIPYPKMNLEADSAKAPSRTRAGSLEDGGLEVAA